MSVALVNSMSWAPVNEDKNDVVLATEGDSLTTQQSNKTNV